MRTAPIQKTAVPPSRPATAASAPDSRGSTIYNKLKPWDVDRDDWLSEAESARLFHHVGLPVAWAHVSAASTGLARGPFGHAVENLWSIGKAAVLSAAEPSEPDHANAAAAAARRLAQDVTDLATRPLSVDLAHIGDSRLKAQSGAFDARAEAIPEQARAFIDSVTDAEGRATLASIKAHVLLDAARSAHAAGAASALLRKYRFGEAYSAWVQLMELAGTREPGRAPYLTREQLQSVYDGTLFEHLLNQTRRHPVSVLNILRELLPATMRA